LTILPHKGGGGRALTSASPASRSLGLQHVLQDDRVVVGGVLGGVEQRELLVRFRELAKAGDSSLVLAQLVAVAALEFRPAVGIVVEPAPELRARSGVLEPQIDAGRGLVEAARPEAVDQDAKAVAGGFVVVDALQGDGHGVEISTSSPLVGDGSTRRAP